MSRKLQMGMMLRCFTLLALIALGYSGSAPKINCCIKADNSFGYKGNTKVGNNDFVTGKAINAKGFNVGKTVGKRLSDFDLIFPNFLFAL